MGNGQQPSPTSSGAFCVVLPDGSAKLFRPPYLTAKDVADEYPGHTLVSASWPFGYPDHHTLVRGEAYFLVPTFDGLPGVVSIMQRFEERSIAKAKWAEDSLQLSRSHDDLLDGCQSLDAEASKRVGMGHPVGDSVGHPSDVRSPALARWERTLEEMSRLKARIGAQGDWDIRKDKPRGVRAILRRSFQASKKKGSTGAAAS